jgi:hypothetical protein
MVSVAGLVLLAFTAPAPAPSSPEPAGPVVDIEAVAPAAELSPGGSAPVTPARPTSPPSAPSSPAPAGAMSEATERRKDEREDAAKDGTRKSRRQRRLAGVGLVGRERANLFQTRVPEAWDATMLINTDRPDFTDALPTIGHRVTYIEAGYNFAKDDGELPTTSVTHTAPELLIRYGMHDRVELRVKATPGLVDDRSNGQLRLIGEHYLGIKAEVFRQQGWWPAHTLVPVINVQNATQKDGGHQIVPELGWVYGWQVRKWIAFRGSTGIDGAPQRFTFGAGPKAGFLEIWQSVSIYWHLHKYIGVHTEWGMFAYPLEPRGPHRVHGFQTYGLYFYPTPEILIDIRVGDTLKRYDSSWFLGGGVSVRIKPIYASRAERRKARTGVPLRVGHPIERN